MDLVRELLARAFNYLHGTQNFSALIMWWALYLQHYYFSAGYIKGADINADWLRSCDENLQ